jgi:hypothetical protein
MSRFNIYSEELTDRIEKVTKEANGNTFYGLRFYLKSPPELHHTIDDDDTSAVTFWANSEDELVDLMDLARAVAGY